MSGMGMARLIHTDILGYCDIFRESEGGHVLPTGSVSMGGGGHQAHATLKQTPSRGVSVMECGHGVRPVVCAGRGESVLSPGLGAQAQYGAPTVAGVVL